MHGNVEPGSWPTPERHVGIACSWVQRPWRLILPCLIGAAMLITTPSSGAEPTVHVVYAGQRLGSIAKRYNVSVEALCNANGIRATDPIQPGQRLYVPPKDDPDGAATRRWVASQAERGSSHDAPVQPAAVPTSTDRTEHVVGPGHTLSKIAARYHVSVAELCRANGLSETAPIRPGQVLVVPRAGSPSTADNTPSPVAEASPTRSPGTSETTPTPAASTARAPSVAAASTKPVRHVVSEGQTLGKVAARYHVSVDALCVANGIDRATAIRPGQTLLVPGPGDPEGSIAARLRATGALDRPTASGGAAAKKSEKPSWHDYRKPPWRRGYVTLVSYTETWSGYVTGPRGEVLPAAHQAICRLMGADGDHPRVDRRLVQLLVKVSDTFGGRPLRVVSGYRTESYALNSRHRRSQAIDFSIPGVPNEALRDYLLTFDRVGVGYYPNSSFVHFDVRERKTYWVDLAGPGEAPRYVKNPSAP